jgi:hemoglobin-like flavoprotein
MTETQVQLINQSFASVLVISDRAAGVFYDRLFELRPAVRPLFKGAMGEQGRKLMHTIGTAVGAARNLPALTAPLQELARRHALYGVRSEHFDDVGAALIYALEKGLGPAFTPATREAWVALYGEIVAIMQPSLEAARGAPPAPAGARAEAPAGRPRSLFAALAAWFAGR